MDEYRKIAEARFREEERQMELEERFVDELARLLAGYGFDTKFLMDLLAEIPEAEMKDRIEKELNRHA